MGKVSLRELYAAAEAEAGAFHLPPPELTGDVEVREAYAIDRDGTLDVDDVVGYDQNSGEFFAAITDFGSVAPRLPAVMSHARRQNCTSYDGNGRAARPMVPRVFSESRFSLLDGQPREALIFPINIDGSISGQLPKRGIVISKQRTPEQVEAILRSGEGPDALALRAIWDVAQHLAPRNNASRRSRQTLESYGFAVRLMVNVAMNTVNLTAGRIGVEQQSVPLIYSNRRPRSELLGDIDQTEAARLLAPLTAASFSTEPHGHLEFSGEPYARATSPLHEYLDLLNASNLSYAAAGRPVPFSLGFLDEVSSRIDRLSARGRVRDKRTGIEIPAPLYRRATYLENVCNNDTASARDVALALWDSVGTAEQIAAAKKAAAHFAMRKSNIARFVPRTAESLGLITFEPAPNQQPGEQQTPQILIRDKAGNTYNYDLAEDPAAYATAATRLVGNVAGFDTEAYLRHQHVASGGRKFLNQLMKSGRTSGWKVVRQEEGEHVTACFSLVVDNIPYTANGIGEDPTTALNDAITRLIIDNNLDRLKKAPKIRLVHQRSSTADA